jgi:GT2 family glycosyltransferase
MSEAQSRRRRITWSIPLAERGRFVSEGEHAEVAVAVVTYNNASDVPTLIDDLRRDARAMSLRLVVVDNDSQDGSADLVAAEQDIILIRSDRNLGFGAGVNQARTRLGPCSAVLILNPDMRVREHAIERMLASLKIPGVGAVVPLNITGADGAIDPTLRREPSIMRALGDAIGGGRRFPSRPGWLSETDMRSASYTREHAVDWATGSAMLIRADVDQSVGNWTEEFFLYSEEIDYCRRIREQGHLVWFDPTAVVEHPGGGGGSGRSTALATLQTVNRVRYVEGRHGRAYATVFRAVVLLSAVIRSHSRLHRESLRFLINRDHWSNLPTAPVPVEQREAL